MDRAFSLLPAACAAFVALAALSGCQTKTGDGESRTAYFKVTGPTDADAFVIALSDPVKIAEARAIVSGAEQAKVHVSGLVVNGTVAWNAPWRFYLHPESIAFFEMAAGTCDAATTYVEAHITEVGASFLPDRRWCPWSSRVAREVPAP
jgi:hypothetical protein